MSKSITKEKEIEIKETWQCPRCKSSSIALNPDWDHKTFLKGYKDFEILVRCCNCQLQFVFTYKLVQIKIH